MKALVIGENGAAEVKDIDTDGNALRELIGGWLEGVRAQIAEGEWFAYCDEEGKLKQRPVNMPATVLARHLGWGMNDVLCGTVVFVAQGKDGEDADVPDGVLDATRDLGLLEGPPAG
jgi:hypothetical protein